MLTPLARAADEAAASLLGILWEARLGQPALASFLDQNWLEGLDRSAPTHFTAVLAGVAAPRIRWPSTRVRHCLFGRARPIYPVNRPTASRSRNR